MSYFSHYVAYYTTILTEYNIDLWEFCILSRVKRADESSTYSPGTVYMAFQFTQSAFQFQDGATRYRFSYPPSAGCGTIPAGPDHTRAPQAGLLDLASGFVLPALALQPASARLRGHPWPLILALLGACLPLIDSWRMVQVQQGPHLKTPTRLKANRGFLGPAGLEPATYGL